MNQVRCALAFRIGHQPPKQLLTHLPVTDMNTPRLSSARHAYQILLFSVHNCVICLKKPSWSLTWQTVDGGAVMCMPWHAMACQTVLFEKGWWHQRSITGWCTSSSTVTLFPERRKTSKIRFQVNVSEAAAGVRKHWTQLQTDNYSNC